jgi:hypothetical protein
MLKLKRLVLTYIIALLWVNATFAQIPGIIGLPDTISRPQMTTFLYISYSDTPYTFVWKYNGVFISSKYYVNYEKAGVYSVDVIKFSQVIHRDTTVVLNSAVIFDRKDTVYICRGDSVELSYPPNKNVHWSLSFPNVPVSSNVDDSSIYLSREADVYASIILGQGGYLVDCFVVVFAPVNSVFLGDDSEFCISKVLDAGDGISYLWSTGETSRTIDYSGASGNVWVSVINKYSCISKDTIYLTKVDLPTSSFFTSDLGAGRIRFTQTNQHSSVNYYWNFGDNKYGVGSTIEHQYSASSANYTVSCQAIHKTANCSTTDSQNISVLISSVEIDKKVDFSIHPNPSSSTINISGLPVNDLNDLLIFDFLGKEVFSQKVKGTLEVDLKDLKNGLYFVHVGSTVKKFIKD